MQVICVSILLNCATSGKDHKEGSGSPRFHRWWKLGRVDSKKNHNGECRARMYSKFEAGKNEKDAKVQTEREQAVSELLPMPTLVDLEAADYDCWLSREATKTPDPIEHAANDKDLDPPAAERPRTGCSSRVSSVDADCDFDGAIGLYAPAETDRARYSDESVASPNKNGRFPPSISVP